MTESATPQIPLPESLKGKKIVLVNHSDTLGGAAVVTFRLLQALRNEGLDVKMIVYTKTGDNRNVDVVSTRFVRGLSFLLERVDIMFANGFNRDDLFKVSTGKFAVNIHRHPWVKEADIVCLNWINQGLMSLDGIRRLHRMGKKIVWTLHDMWSVTGICHHAYECEYNNDGCGNCMFLAGGGNPEDLSHRMWMKKKQLYSDVPIHFVPVSHWLEERARRSSLMDHADITTIPNAFPVEKFHTAPLRHISEIDIYQKPNVLLFGAARIDDPIKGLDYTIDALNYIFDNYPEVATQSVILFFGDIRDSSRLDRLRFSHKHLGRISDFRILRHMYATAKVVISTSLYETLPGTLIEGQASGALPVTFGRGGQEDIIEHLKTGYIARYKDPVSVAEGIMWAISNTTISREELHENVRSKFAAPVVARRYIELFDRILTEKSL